MKKLQAYLNGLPTLEQAAYAKRSGTTVGYLRKCISTGQKIGEGICINLERESSRAVTVEDLRDDVDWAYLRNSSADQARSPQPMRRASDRPHPMRRSTDAPAAEGAAFNPALPASAN